MLLIGMSYTSFGLTNILWRDHSHALASRDLDHLYPPVWFVRCPPRSTLRVLVVANNTFVFCLRIHYLPVVFIYASVWLVPCGIGTAITIPMRGSSGKQQRRRRGSQSVQLPDWDIKKIKNKYYCSFLSHQNEVTFVGELQKVIQPTPPTTNIWV